MSKEPEINNVLVSELKATLNRVTIIKDNISDDLTKNLSANVEQVLGQIIAQVKQALENDR